MAWTKEQKSAYDKQYREKNLEKLKKYQKSWHENNKEYVKAYLKENAETIKEREKKYREENKDKIKELWQEWYVKNPNRSPRRRFTEARNKAITKRKLTWTLTFEEYEQLIQEPCIYCRNELAAQSKRAVGLDRLDNTRGYESDNVASCCFICNTIKNDFLTVEETYFIVKNLLEFRKLNTLQLEEPII